MIAYSLTNMRQSQQKWDTLLSIRIKFPNGNNQLRQTILIHPLVVKYKSISL